MNAKGPSLPYFVLIIACIMLVASDVLVLASAETAVHEIKGLVAFCAALLCMVVTRLHAA